MVVSRASARRAARRWAVAGLFAAVVAVLGPAVVLASTVGYVDPGTTACEPDQDCNGLPPDPPTLEYEAAPGEANKLEATRGDGVVTFRDAGATIASREDCKTLPGGEAECRLRGTWAAGISLGDLPDVFSVSGALRARVSGGDGDDVLSGGPNGNSMRGDAGDDRLMGADGEDWLDGGGGSDVLLGGPGDDLLFLTEPVPALDRVDGGDGLDTVYYMEATRGITAALRASAGSEREGDTFASVENLVGGAADDVLSGNDGPNVLSGDAGRDRLDGEAGADTLSGGSGIDRIIAGAGDDSVTGSLDDRGADRISCGPGSDEVSDPGPRDLLDASCEIVGEAEREDFLELRMRAHPVVRRGVARFRVSCPDRRGCRGSVRVRRSGARRGGVRRTYRTRRSGPVTFAIPLPPRARRVRVSVSSVRAGDWPDAHRLSWTIAVP